jgi:hypothetical protein
VSVETDLGGSSLDAEQDVSFEHASTSTTQERATLATSLIDLNATLQGILASTQEMASKEYVEAWQADQERKRSRFVAMVIGVGVCFLVIFALMGMTLFKVYDLTSSIEDNTKTVIDCTAPSIDPHSCFSERRRIQQASQEAETEKIIDQITNTISQKVGDRVEQILKERLP